MHTVARKSDPAHQAGPEELAEWLRAVSEPPKGSSLDCAVLMLMAGTELQNLAQHLPDPRRKLVLKYADMAFVWTCNYMCDGVGANALAQVLADALENCQSFRASGLPSGTPSWVTVALVDHTLQVWQPRYAKQHRSLLSFEEAVELVKTVGQLVEVAA